METAEIELPEIEIGTVIQFDEEGFQNSIIAWKKHLFPAIENVKIEYEDLGLGKFTQEIYSDIKKGISINDISNIQMKLRAVIDTAVEKSPMNILYSDAFVDSQISQRLAPLRIAIGNLKRSLDSAIGGIGSSKLGSLKLHLDQVKIVGGKPVLDEESIRSMYSVKIKEEYQVEVWSKAVEVKRVWDEFVDLLIKNGYPIDYCRVGSSGDPDDSNYFVHEQPDGKLYLDPVSLTMFRK